MPERRLEENRFVFTDLHLGEGMYKNGKKNNLEHFEADDEFLKTATLIIEKYAAPNIILELNLLGDTFDFLTVEYTWEAVNKKNLAVKKSRILAEPLESASVQKLQKIMDAHPKVVRALQLFLKHGKIKFFIGNHDFELVWPRVQEKIKDILASGCKPEEKEKAKERVAFVFKEIKNKVLLEHGHDAEYMHSTSEEKIFLYSHLGKLLDEPHLNIPYGNHLMTDIVNKLATGSRLCKYNPWVGRLEPHWYVYLESLWKNWWFGIYAVFMWLIAPLRHRFSRRWWVRKNASFRRLFRYNLDAMISTVLNTLRGRDYTHYPKKILKENNDIDAVILGHVHTFRQETTENGTYVFIWPWCVVYRPPQFPQKKLKWTRFKRLEKIYRMLGSIQEMFNKKTRHLYEPKRCDMYSFALCKFYSDGYKELYLLHYNQQLNCLEKLT